jgi:thiol-disulfide isomerase/thioredoxin
MKEKELNREERNKTVMETGALVMAEFYADWCPHCQKMMPIVKEFKELEEWSSLTALSVIAMIDEEYDVKIKGDDVRNSQTINDLYEIVKSRL